MGSCLRRMLLKDSLQVSLRVRRDVRGKRDGL